jgi:hypothetical protein
MPVYTVPAQIFQFNYCNLTKSEKEVHGTLVEDNFLSYQNIWKVVCSLLQCHTARQSFLRFQATSMTCSTPSRSTRRSTTSWSLTRTTLPGSKPSTRRLRQTKSSPHQASGQRERDRFSVMCRPDITAISGSNTPLYRGVYIGPRAIFPENMNY